MSEHNFLEIKKLLEGIQSSFSLNFWHQIFLVLAGLVPALFVAWLAYRKEISLFNINKEKEDNRIKAKLAGEIIASGYNLSVNILQHMDVAFIFHYKQKCVVLMKNNMQKIDDIVEESLENLDKQLSVCNTTTLSAKLEFNKLLGEYRYYINDAELDRIVNEFLNDKLKFPESFLKMERDDFKKIDFEKEREKQVSEVGKIHTAKIGKIIDYIFQKKA